MSFPNFTFWSHLLANVGVEVCGLAALGFAAQCLFRSAVWKRAVWQMTVICLLLLPVSEWTGFGRGTAGYLFGHKRVVEKAPASGYPVFKSGIADGRLATNFVQPLAPARPAVWWPGWFWLGGALLVLGRMAAAQVLLLALRFRREKIVSQSLRERVAFVARSVGLRRKVSLLWMPQSISPMAFGILRPSIGLPPGFETKLRSTEQEAVLAHELAHLAALDPLWFLLADFATAWLWWHPLAWWVRRSLHGAAELAADEATAMVPDGPGALADCLVTLGKEMTASRGWSWVGINGGFRSNLGKRVERLMRMSGDAKRPFAGWAGTVAKLSVTILVVPTIVLLFGSFQSAHAQKEESWRGQLLQSWNSSPGAVLVLAALDDAQSKKEDIATPPRRKVDIATRVTNGKLLYEMHKFDEAETILLQVIKDEPTNRSAPYYLDLIKEARYMAQRRQQPAAGSNSSPQSAEDHPSPSTKWYGSPIPNSTGTSNLSIDDIYWTKDNPVPSSALASNLVYTSQRGNIATRVQNGKLLFEMGKYDEAEAILLQVIKDETTNHSAPYYLDLIKEARYMDGARRRQEEFRQQPTPNPLDSNLVYTTKGRQFILSKLTNIIMDEVSFDLPLKDALLKVRNESRKLDPDGVGVNFMINQDVEGPTSSTNNPTAGAHQAKDIGVDVTIKISPPLRNLRLEDVLDAITKVADSPIRYTVEDYAVVFSPGRSEPDSDLVLYNKTFRVDSKVFLQGLQKVTDVHLEYSPQNGSSLVTNTTLSAHQLVSDYFASLGVDLTPPKAVFFNDRLGELLVRATLADLELIEPAIEKLNRTPPQVTIETRFVELSQTESQGLGLNSYLGSTPLSNGVVRPKAGAVPPIPTPSNLANPSGIFLGPSTIVLGTTTNTSTSRVVAATTLNGILSDPEFRLLLNAIEHSTGADILAAPKVTTLSGRQAHLGVPDANNGVGLDVIVEVGPDGFALQTAVVASIKRGAQTWEFSASHKIWDGQTLVFSGVMTNQPAGVRKEMMVFVTPTIIDPAGNRVHTEDDLSKRTGIPDQ